MKELLAIVGAIALGVVIYFLLAGSGGKTSGSLAGAAQGVVSNAITQVGGVAP